MILSFAFILTRLQTAPDWNQKLTLTQKATSLGQMLDVISKQTGTKITMDNRLAREIVLVSVKDKPLKLVLDKIAKVSDAKVVFRTDQAKFEVDTAKRASEVAEKEKEYLVNLNGGAAQLEKILQPRKSKNGDKIFPQAEQILRTKIALAMPRYQLAKLADNQRIVFSSSPNRMQQPLNVDGLAGLVSNWVAQSNLQVEAMAQAIKQGQDQAESSDPALDPEFLQMIESRMQKKITTRPEFLIATFKKTDEPSLAIKVYDNTGKVILSTSQYLGATPLGRAESVDAKLGAPTPADVPAPSAPKPDPGSKIELSENSLKFAKFCQAGRSGLTPVDEEFRLILDRPDLYDPLSFSASEFYLHRALKQGRDIVANMQDDLVLEYASTDGIDVLDQAVKSTASKPLVPSENEEPKVINTDDSDGILSICPADQLANRADRVDRFALARLVAEAKTAHVISLDTMSTYALNNPNPMSFRGLAYSYVTTLIPQFSGFNFPGTDNWEAMRVYAKIPASVRQLLRAGDALPLTSLGAEFEPYFANQVMNLNIPLSNLAQSAKTVTALQNGAFDELFKDLLNHVSGNETEPTLICSNGVPRQSLVRLHVTPEPYFYSLLTGGGRQNALPLGVLEVGLMKTMATIPGVGDTESGGVPQFDKLYLGQRDSISFSIQVSADSGFSGYLVDHRPPDMANAYTLSTLPAAESKMIDNLAEKMKKSKFFAMMTSFGAGMGQGPKKP